jgi:hypothetical protein
VILAEAERRECLEAVREQDVDKGSGRMQLETRRRGEGCSG